jgi:hypothetical protein
MSDQSPVLSLPLLQAAQAQKHVTHNEALRLLDVLVQGVVLTRGANVPPVGPAVGDRHLVGNAPTGAWAGQPRRLALWEATGWAFIEAKEGWTFHVLDEDAPVTLIDGDWRSLTEGDLSVGAVGVGTAADPVTNRLSVVSPAALFSHDGAGHQVKINKAAAGDTASLLFQTGFSGRAEIGTLASDSFRISVSGSGASFQTALEAVPATGHVRLPQGVLSDGFTLRDAAQPTRAAVFDLSAVPAATTQALTVPALSGTLGLLEGAQTFTGDKTFSGGFAVTAASASIGTATGTATLDLGTGATGAGATKTVNLGTGGVSGSTTVVNLGSAVAGAGGSLVVNSPTVTFAASVGSVAMPEASLSAKYGGFGGAVGDATNRLAVNAPAVLFNNAGAGCEATVNKAAAGDDAALAFKTGFSARALFGLLASDDLSLKVSADGSSYAEALRVDRTTARVALPAPLLLPGQTGTPGAPGAAQLALSSHQRAGAMWLDVTDPAGRTRSVQSHLGLGGIGRWSPNSGTTVTTEGFSIATTGTVSTPLIAATSLATAMKRWRVTSAATASSAADQRSAQWVCMRGNLPRQGGFTAVFRVTLATLQATGTGFFGLHTSGGALAGSTALTSLTGVIGVGFTRGTHDNWQVVQNDNSGAATVTDLGSSFPVNVTDLYTLLLWAAPNAGSVWVRLVNETTGAASETELTGEIPSATATLTPRLHLSNGATAAAVAYDCGGVCIETDI